MSLPHAILALLENENASGYDLARHFAHSAGHIWSATHQQIYLELGKLHQAGWVSYDVVSQDGKPDKKVYGITTDGTGELIRWLQRPSSLKRVREPLLIKVLGSHLIDTDQLIEELKRQREDNEISLSHFLKIEAEFKRKPVPLSLEQRSTYLALRRGILDRKAWLEWASEAEQMLERDMQAEALNESD